MSRTVRVTDLYRTSLHALEALLWVAAGFDLGWGALQLAEAALAGGPRWSGICAVVLAALALVFLVLALLASRRAVGAWASYMTVQVMPAQPGAAGRRAAEMVDMQALMRGKVKL